MEQVDKLKAKGLINDILFIKDSYMNACNNNNSTGAILHATRYIQKAEEIIRLIENELDKPNIVQGDCHGI